MAKYHICIDCRKVYGRMAAGVAGQNQTKMYSTVHFANAMVLESVAAPAITSLRTLVELIADARLLNTCKPPPEEHESTARTVEHGSTDSDSASKSIRIGTSDNFILSHMKKHTHFHNTIANNGRPR